MSEPNPNYETAPYSETGWIGYIENMTPEQWLCQHLLRLQPQVKGHLCYTTNPDGSYQIWEVRS